MKTKKEKIEELLTITYYGISDEKLNDIAKGWSHNGLDTLKEMWHKYYNTKSHEIISKILISHKERELYLCMVDVALGGIQ